MFESLSMLTTPVNVSAICTFPLPFSLPFADKENDFYFLKSSRSTIQFCQGNKSLS